MAWVHNEDCVRKVLRRCSPAGVTLFSATCRANLALGREEALWELLFVRCGLRFRPAHWAASAADGEEDELEPASWRKAFLAHKLQIQGQGLHSCLVAPVQPGVKRFQVCSGSLALPQALAQAADGDIIELAPGCYPPVIVSRPVFLVGMHRDCVEVAGICVRAGGVTAACITIARSKSPVNAEWEATGEGAPAHSGDDSAVRVLAGSLRIFDCNIAGRQGIDVEKGASCLVQGCDIEAERCCFRGTGDLDSCRLKGLEQLHAMSSEQDQAASMIADFLQGRSRVLNCIVDSQSIRVGLKLRSSASVEVIDSDIRAWCYGVSAQGCRHHEATSLILHSSRVSRCLEAAVHLENTGFNVQILESEISSNVVGVLAEGWRRPERHGCCLRDRAISSRPTRLSPSGMGKRVGDNWKQRNERHRRLKIASPLAVAARKSATGQSGEGAGGGGVEDGDSDGGGGGKGGGETKVCIEGCHFRHNQRAVQVVSNDMIASHWSVPLNR